MLTYAKQEANNTFSSSPGVLGSRYYPNNPVVDVLERMRRWSGWSTSVGRMPPLQPAVGTTDCGPGLGTDGLIGVLPTSICPELNVEERAIRRTQHLKSSTKSTLLEGKSERFYGQ